MTDTASRRHGRVIGHEGRALRRRVNRRDVCAGASAGDLRLPTRAGVAR